MPFLVIHTLHKDLMKVIVFFDIQGQVFSITPFLNFQYKLHFQCNLKICDTVHDLINELKILIDSSPF